jgi:hypothetical protein
MLFPGRNAAFMVSIIGFDLLVRASIFRLNQVASSQSAFQENKHERASSWG